MRLPGFTNKKYGTDFYVQARKTSTDTYHLRDFKLHAHSQDSSRHNHQNRSKPKSSPLTMSQSEQDWAFAKRALARGDDPESAIWQPLRSSMRIKEIRTRVVRIAAEATRYKNAGYKAMKLRFPFRALCASQPLFHALLRKDTEH